MITGRVREPRAPSRFPHTRAPLQTAQQQLSSSAGPLLSPAERAALVGRFDAKRWPIRRTIGRRSVAQPSRGHRGQLRRLGAALESPHER